jgi:hypothetical protein
MNKCSMHLLKFKRFFLFFIKTKIFFIGNKMQLILFNIYLLLILI